MTITPDVIARTKQFEGSIAWMYLDTTSNVTVGVGHLLSTADDAAALPFADQSTGQPAADRQKRTDFVAVSQSSPGQNAASYQSLTNCRLDDSDIDNLLSGDLGAVEGALRNAFPSYDSFPGPAQAGLIDMGFNLGVSGLLSKFPTFCQAVQNQDWTTAANQCHRLGVSDQRNDTVKQLFLNAAGGTHVRA